MESINRARSSLLPIPKTIGASFISNVIGNKLPGDGSIWWENNAEDVDNRHCLFDDVYVFEADGTFRNELGDATWLSTPVQTFALLSGVSVVCFVFVAKLTSSERAVKKMGLFPYIFIAVLNLAAFVASLLGNLP